MREVRHWYSFVVVTFVGESFGSVEEHDEDENNEIKSKDDDEDDEEDAEE